jgi:hypothetical protein
MGSISVPMTAKFSSELMAIGYYNPEIKSSKKNTILTIKCPNDKDLVLTLEQLILGKRCNCNSCPSPDTNVTDNPQNFISLMRDVATNSNQTFIQYEQFSDVEYVRIKCEHSNFFKLRLSKFTKGFKCNCWQIDNSKKQAKRAKNATKKNAKQSSEISSQKSSKCNVIEGKIDFLKAVEQAEFLPYSNTVSCSRCTDTQSGTTPKYLKTGDNTCTKELYTCNCDECLFNYNLGYNTIKSEFKTILNRLNGRTALTHTQIVRSIDWFEIRKMFESFTQGMTVDHIIPLCYFDLNNSIHLRWANDRRNLRFLSEEENKAKSHFLFPADLDLIKNSNFLTMVYNHLLRIKKLES